MTKPSISALVADLKERGEDFEFYPTTQEIIDRVLRHMDGDDGPFKWDRSYNKTVMDIGAGHGAFLRAVQAKHEGVDLLAIEKSERLIAELVKFAKVIGTDFHAQSLVTKHVDVVFCNPPYREYELWAERLIRECGTGHLYLVIPQRWSKNPNLAAAIKAREAKVTVLGQFDFLEADRQARARVEVLYLRLHGEEDQLFADFFRERFGPLCDKLDKAEARSAEAARQAAEAAKAAKAAADEKRRRAVQGDGLIAALVKWYDQDMTRIRANYDKLMSLDTELLAELSLSVRHVIDTLKAKLDELKNQYWAELFSHMGAVTSKLSTKNRQEMTRRIGGFKAVDFTAPNIYAILLWILENANKYIESQTLEIFDSMIGKANIINYKSNKRVFGDGDWRYCRRPEGISHVSLDFRLVMEHSGGITRSYSGKPRLAQHAANFISDLLTLANLLGFRAATDDARLHEGDYRESEFWEAGKPQLFQDDKGEDVVEVRAFLNGNMHLRLAQRFAMAINVTVGKLRGWLRSKTDAVHEFGAEAGDLFDRPLLLTTGALPCLEMAAPESPAQHTTTDTEDLLRQQAEDEINAALRAAEETPCP